MNDTPTMQTKNSALFGRFAVANSAGIIAWYEGDPYFDSKRAAQSQADIESASGWCGDCWAVRFVPQIVI